MRPDGYLTELPPEEPVCQTCCGVGELCGACGEPDGTCDCRMSDEFNEECHDCEGTGALRGVEATDAS